MLTKLHIKSYLPTFKYPKILGCYTAPTVPFVEATNISWDPELGTVGAAAE
jgi:hypothetical protein